MTALVAAVCAALGLAVGPLLAVVAARVAAKEPLLAAGRCPSCDAEVPVGGILPTGWTAGRARCRACRAPLAAGVRWMPVAAALLFAANGARFGARWALLPFLVFAGSLLVLSVIDVRHYLLPNRVIYPTGYATAPLLAAAAVLEGEPRRIAWAGAVALAGFAFFFLLNLVYPRGMAFGDVRLSFLIGMHLGWLRPALAFLGFFLAFLVASVVGIGLLLAGRGGLKTRLPFGPFLAAGAQLAVVAGGPLVRAWLT